MLPTRCLLVAATLLLPASSYGQSAVDEMLATFQSRLEAGADIDDLCDAVEKLESAHQQALIAQLERAWPGVRDRYLSAFTTASKQGGTGARGEATKRIRQLREDFLGVYALEEGAMKAKLKEVSKPAVDELRKLLSPTAEELLAAASPALKRQRDAAHKLAVFRDAALDAALTTIPANSRESLATAEEKIAVAASTLPRNSLKILEKNRKIAQDAKVPEEEAKGIEECNFLRLYVGLSALVLDPKLCEAARGHSTDMAEVGFFAHESPVEGKKTPWDRAAKAGTSASGENIYAGSSSSHDANMGWFYSPGHHKNMFSPGQIRIGLGQHESHWTQLFGR